MRMRVAILLAGAVVAVAAFLLGRATVGSEGGYEAGLRAGRAFGVQEGRALERGRSLPPGSRRAARAEFDAGYADGANDVFGGYDGGWSLRTPYLITLRRAGRGVTYRIDSRVPLRRGVGYYVCPRSGAVCQIPLARP
jgi:hypothetical protein